MHMNPRLTEARVRDAVNKAGWVYQIPVTLNPSDFMVSLFFFFESKLGLPFLILQLCTHVKQT